MTAFDRTLFSVCFSVNSSGTELGSRSFSPSLHIHDRESDMAGEGGQDWTLATVDSARAKAKSRIPHSVQHQLKGDAGSKGEVFPLEEELWLCCSIYQAGRGTGMKCFVARSRFASGFACFLSAYYTHTTCRINHA